ncbi:MAG: HAD-IC family P-type ATPase, partial [Patescibacteria group bacterium]|nr:HAD-IC family P-type ATPase [Patescibacteria group bacterium]
MRSERWHTLPTNEVLKQLGTQEQGLSAAEASSRLKKYGPNALPEQKGESYLAMFIRQFRSPLIYVLFAAAGVIYFIGEHTDSLIILGVLVFNAIIGAVQEGRAQNTLRALKRFAETYATVLRDQKERVLPDAEVVPGDILVLSEGEKVASDARLLTVNSLAIDEASLTGESKPVRKNVSLTLKPAVPEAEQRNMVFKGTHVVAGNGHAVVVATGKETFIGRIAKQIATIDTEIPLKADIRRLSRAIIGIVAGISGIILVVGLMSGETLATMFKIVVSLSVSVIPEGLPIVMTLVLATGVWRMSKRNALVKRLQAVEALGQARIIAVDKTGTLTKNEQVIQKIYTEDKYFEVSGVGYEAQGEIRNEGGVIEPQNHPDLLFAAKVATLCASARVSFDEKNKRWRVAGDPTEAALLVFGEKAGFEKDKLEQEMPLISEVPFDYSLKYHATLHNKADNKNLLVVVGAPEVVLKLCGSVRVQGKNRKLTAKKLTELENVHTTLSGEGLRVLAFAVREIKEGVVEPATMPSLAFAGFFGMKDGLRLEVAEAMRKSREAGVRVVMITGDHKITARAIAKEAGIYKEGDEIITGEELRTLKDTELLARLPRVSVFARVTPEHKLRIIELYKKRGDIVAMTGDGVNDAPSLVAADLGVAMGNIGTEVAKEASDIVLLDDNFGSIVSAIEEGRSIYKTIKKVILYLFSTSAGEVLTILGALLIGYPLPLLASQIIWLNFVTDPFLDVALAMESKEKGLLTGHFKRPGKYLLDRLMVTRMVVMSLPMAVGTLFLFSLYAPENMGKALTVSLTTLAVFQWFNAWNCRHERESVFTLSFWTNKYLVGAMAVVFILQLLAVYTPFLQNILHTEP